MQSRLSIGVRSRTRELLAALALAPSISAAAETAAPPLLQAPLGVTAIAGRIADAQGLGLPGVRVADNAASTATDSQGRFILAPVIVGKSVLQIDGRRVGRAMVDYGFYEVHVLAQSGRTTSLDFTNYLTPVDHAHDVTVASGSGGQSLGPDQRNGVASQTSMTAVPAASPTTADMIVKTPAIPGLELFIPRGTVIRDANGKPVLQVGITAVSLKYLPYPMPSGVNIPFAYTIQPSGACLYDAQGGVGYARITYPNVFHHLPRARETFWTYEPDREGWRAYGTGQVSDDGSQVIPDRNTIVTDFYSAECDEKTRSHLLKITPPLPSPGVSR